MNFKLKYFFALVFYILGPLQSLGLIGYYDSILILISILLSLIIIKKYIYINLNVLLLIVLFLILSFSLINTDKLLLYFLFTTTILVPPILTKILFYNYTFYLKKSHIDYFLIIQLLITSFQFIISDYISIEGVSSYDMMYGTLFKGTDHVLAFSALGAFLILEKRRELNLRRIFLIAGLILFTNSKVSIIMVIIVALYYFYLRVRNTNIIVGISIVAIIIALFYYPLIEVFFITLNNTYGVKQIEAVNSIFTQAMGNRIAAVLYFISNDLVITGKGMFSLYNPIEGEFNAGGDFSLLIWLYYDLGIIGLIYFVLVTAFLLKKQYIMYPLFILISLVFVSFSDVPFLILTLLVVNELTKKNVNYKLVSNY